MVNGSCLALGYRAKSVFTSNAEMPTMRGAAGHTSKVMQCRIASPRSDSRNSSRFALALQNSPISTRRGKAILNFVASQCGRLRCPPVSPVHRREVVVGRQRVRVVVPQDFPPLGEHLLQRGCL